MAFVFGIACGLGLQVTSFCEVGRLRCARASIPPAPLLMTVTGLFPLRNSCVPLRPSLAVSPRSGDFPALYPLRVPRRMEVVRGFSPDPSTSSTTLFANVINFSTDRSIGVLYCRIWTCSGGGSHDSSSAQVEPGSVWCMSAANEGW